MAARGEREVINLVDDKDEPQPAKGVGAPAKGGGARVAPPPPPVQNVGVQLAGVAPPPPTQNFEFVERLVRLPPATARENLCSADRFHRATCFLRLRIPRLCTRWAGTSYAERYGVLHLLPCKQSC